MFREKKNNPWDNKKQLKKGYSGFSLFMMGFSILAFTILLSAMLSSEYKNSAALYVGFPLIIGLTFGFIFKRSNMSVAASSAMTLTILLVISMIFFKEGFICIIMAAPILYSVLALITVPIDYFLKARAKGKKGTKLHTGAIVVVLAALSLEGTHPVVTFDRHNVVESSKVIAFSIEDIREKMAEEPVFSKAAPLLSRIFPKPVISEGTGIEVGSVRKFHFIYNKWLYFNAHEGDVICEVVESKPDYIKFSVIKDESYLGNYLSWHSGEIFLEKEDDGNTKVTSKIAFTRKLDPIWYFGPMQTYMVGVAAEILIDNLATPNKG